MDPLATDERYQAFHKQVPSLAIIGNTPLVQISTLGENLKGFKVFAKQEWRNPGGSLKDRPVKRMLLEAIIDGRLTKDKTIIDSSSGNAGIAYAMIGRALGYKVKLFVPANASNERKMRLAAHRAEVVYTDAMKGYDFALTTCHEEAHKMLTNIFSVISTRITTIGWRITTAPPKKLSSKPVGN